MAKEKIKIYCCEKCPYWDNCEVKWIRGEKGLEQLCCAACDYILSCLKKI